MNHKLTRFDDESNEDNYNVMTRERPVPRKKDSHSWLAVTFWKLRLYGRLKMEKEMINDNYLCPFLGPWRRANFKWESKVILLLQKENA